MNAVRTRAYRIWETRGRPDGEHESHWQQALAELGLVGPIEQRPLPIGSETVKRQRSKAA